MITVLDTVKYSEQCAVSVEVNVFYSFRKIRERDPLDSR